MKLTKVEKKENNLVELHISVEANVFEDACQAAYRKNVSKINLQGFRPGKAPRKMIEKFYGEDVFYEDAMNICLPDAYEAAVKEAGIEPIDQPGLTDFDVKDGVFEFVAVVPVKPEVELGEYKGLEAERPDDTVAEADVEAELTRMQERNARQISVERPAQSGDTVVIDFEGSVDGVPFDGGKADNYALQLGSNTFIPGFEDQLIGAQAGDEKDVNVTFPEEYGEASLAGKPAVFKCKVHEVKESQKPELDDEFAKDVSEFDTLEALKADIMAKMTENKKRYADGEFEEKLMAQVVESMKGEIPDKMVENQLDNVVQDFGYRLAMQGMELDAYLKMQNMEMKDFRGLFRDQALKQVKTRLAMEKIAELEGMSVSDEDVEAEFKKIAEENHIEVEQVRQYISADDLKKDLLVQKAAELVRTTGKVVNKAE